MNTPAGNTVSTAEHAIALMLAMSAQRGGRPTSRLIEGRWDRKQVHGLNSSRARRSAWSAWAASDLAVAARAQGLRDATSSATTRSCPKTAPSRSASSWSRTVDDMLPRVDYLTVHTPLTDETRGMIDPRPSSRSSSQGARLVNGARGGIYERGGPRRRASSRGKLAGVALDVYPDEPCTENPLFGMPGVVCTPHLGASTEEAQTLGRRQRRSSWLRRSSRRGPSSACRERDGRSGPDDARHSLQELHRRGPPPGASWRRGASRRAGSGLVPLDSTVASWPIRDTKVLTSAFAVGLCWKHAMGERR